MKKLLVILTLLISHQICAQIVTIEPAFFDISSDITVTYDAKEGNGGLINVSQVYMHAGLIIEGIDGWNHVQGNWGTADEKVRMTNIGNSRHQISYNIEEFHEVVGQGIEITALAFVFRNDDGSKEGKTANLGDIFVDVPEANGFSGFFQSPDEPILIKELGNTVDIKVIFNEEAEYKLYEDDNLILEDTGTDIEYELLVTEGGVHSIRFEADNGTEIITDSIGYIVTSAPIIEDPPAGTKLGLTRLSDTEARLCLFAPDKNWVAVTGSITNWDIRNTLFLKNSIDGSLWWTEVSNLDPEAYETYMYIVDGKHYIADPFSELVVDTWHDYHIPEESFSGIPDVPETIAGRVTMFKPKIEPYPWQHTDYVKPEKQDLIIYEIQMRDFLEAQNYQTLIDTLDYLENLGINAIELMPVSEFERNQSWGYDVSFHMALDKIFGDPETFKAFIDEAHSRGMVVILDVVFNHAFGQNPYVGLYWDDQNSRPSADSPFFNPVAKHPFNVGFDFNHESPATKEFVKRVCEFWIREFKVDGFRFDLSKGFTQKFSSNNDQMSAYDASRVAIINDYADFIWSIDPDFYVILEHFASWTEERALTNHGSMVWGNANYNFNEATMGYHDGGKSDFRWTYWQNRQLDGPYMVAYMESHDEERLMYKNITYGNSQGNYNIKGPETGYDRVEMASAFFFMIPGAKMIWQFGELGYDYSINWCSDGTINHNCRLTPKPLRWDYFEDESRKDIYRTFAKLIHLKKTDDLLKTTDVEMNVAGAMKGLKLNGQNSNAVVIGNFDVVEGTIVPNFQHTGIWYDYLTGDSINVTNVSEGITLDPGEYYVYLDKKVDFTNSSFDDYLSRDKSILVFPNPSQGSFSIRIKSNTSADLSLQLRSIDGQLINQSRLVKIHEGINTLNVYDQINIDPGVYFLIVNDGNNIWTEKVIIQN